ncbi:hypothetical protein BDR05DRAFT_1059803 [Suillus weaverae]|nr:hypothetical protein BDR05DRAFT_1059803 [Suillus weaverae]
MATFKRVFVGDLEIDHETRVPKCYLFIGTLTERGRCMPLPRRPLLEPPRPAPKPAKPSLLPSSSLVSSSARAVVAISTSDGHVLEFDPLQTSPRALDALVASPTAQRSEHVRRWGA